MEVQVGASELWCQCRGNASATPHQVLVQEQMVQLHAQARRHALWYVCVVGVVYLLGLALIIRRSGRSERRTVVSALAFCCPCLASYFPSGSGSSSRSGKKQQQQEPLHPTPSCSSSWPPQQQQRKTEQGAGKGRAEITVSTLA